MYHNRRTKTCLVGEHASLIPICIAFAIPAPTMPPAADFIAKAPLKIDTKTAGICVACIMMITSVPTR